MNLGSAFDQNKFSEWVEKFLPDFKTDFRQVEKPVGFGGAQSIVTLGESALGIRVFIIQTNKDPSGRKIGLAKESFNLLKNYGTPNALIAYYSTESSKWRLSLLTSTAEWSQGKIITKLSNPKRQSYVLGPQSKVNTPTRFLLKKEAATDITDLKSRFSLEVVNKEFYKEISESFIKLVGGTIGTGRNQKIHSPVLKLPFIADHSQVAIEFSVRLIGRIIFCWFLREKRSSEGTSLMPKELVSLEAINNNSNYYHQVLEPIFFEVLNQPVKARKDAFYAQPYAFIPYLNGGLFSPHEDDFYKRKNEDLQSQFHNALIIPDVWFLDLFKTLETYNFTIDENTSFDEELSIDPEMLGRIFENLLAEINPETGESARKSTGSYYTPRVIVDYMVDQSLVHYLQHHTNIEENKLKSIISYDLTDDSQYPLNENEKQQAINALEKIKILDPACGSGAFPIGALQKMVFILQQIDPDGQLWFRKQIGHTSPEIRRVLEREFAHKNFDYIRKLGVIRENIYGIDIQPIATEISRLRCFLTLVVDERIDDSLENRGIEPLPNLDFKFVTANSLIGLPATGNQVQFGLFEDSEGISELKEIRDLFFNASGSEREVLKLQFVQAQNKMFQRLISEGRRGHADLTTKLTSWDPFSHKKSEWFDPEWMFGIKEGFDVVIANPPYIKEDTHKNAFDGLRNYDCYQGKMDLWYLFGSRGIDVLKNQGVLCFIATNNWISNDGASKFRNKILKESKIVNFVDFGAYKVFSAGIQTMVMLAIKGNYSEWNTTYARLQEADTSVSSLNQFLSSNNNIVNKNYTKYQLTLNPNEYINQYITFLPPDISDVIEKIKHSGSLTLNENEIFSGIDVMQDFVNKSHIKKLTNDSKIGDGIFVISNDEYLQVKWNEKELGIIKPYFTTKEINRNKADPHNKFWIIYTSPEINNKISEFPNIKNHLDQYKKIITSVNKPYGLHRTRDEGIFLGKKIFSIRKCATPSFSRVNFPCYVSRAFLIIKTERVDLDYLSKVLNSKIAKFWLRYKGKMQGNLYQIDKNPLMSIPILIPNVKNIADITSVDDEEKINFMLYKLYGLSPNEIKILEGDKNVF